MNSKNVLSFFIFLLLACCQNNEELNSNSKLKVLEKNIEIINNHPPEYDPNDTLDIISFTENTTKEIVDLINESNINPDSIKGLNKTIDFGHLKTYSYGYWSGGTRGFVTYSILTYENNNEHHAANLSRNVKARFESLIKLDSISYLLLGADKAWSSTYSNIAYFIRLSNDKIDINYPAFVNRPYLNFYNGTYEYDTTTNILKFQGEQAEPIHEVFNSKEKYGEFAKDSVSSRKLFEMIEGFEYYDNKNRFFLKYNGKDFEKVSDSLWNYRTVRKGYLDSLLFNICSTEDVEFTDLYLEMQSIDYDKHESLILVDSLKENGFKVKNWGRGNWMEGPRIVSFKMTNGQCECQVDKLYYYTESENNFEVSERIKCYEDNK